MSRLESGTLHVAVESCDPSELAIAVVAAARAHLPGNLTLSLEAEPDVPPVAADADKVRQILTNLVDNAVKYSPDGGKITSADRDDDACVRFAVADQGLGMPAREHGRIFEKFYRLDPELTRGVGGTGLGLYISRELVRRMNGRISVESDGGRGLDVHRRAADRALAHEEAAAHGPPFERLFARRFSRRRAFVDVGAPAGAAADAAPRRPEDHRDHEADDADDQQDHADGLDAHAGDGRGDRPREDRAGGDEKNADTNSHVRSSFGLGSAPESCLRRARCLNVRGPVRLRVVGCALRPRKTIGSRREMRRGAIVQLTLLALIIGGLTTAVAVIPNWLPPTAVRAGRPDRLRLLVRDDHLHRHLRDRDRGARVLGLEVPGRAGRRLRTARRSTATRGSRSRWTAIPFALVTSMAIISAVVLARNDRTGSNPLQRRRHRAAVRLDVQVSAAEGPDDEHPPAADQPADALHAPGARRASTRSGFRNSGRSRTPCPGRRRNVTVTPNKIGTYPIICTELCGLGHAVMRSTVVVMSQADFDKWAKAGGKAAGGGGGAAAGKAVFVNNGCGACHTLKAAGAPGKIGPDLDKLPDVRADGGQAARSNSSVSRSSIRTLTSRRVSRRTSCRRPSSRCRRTSSTRS